jgi:hypothetical protein
VSGLKASLPDPLAAKVKTTAADWQSGGKMQRLWQRGATLWTGAFSRITHFPIPHLLDSTDPAQVKAFEHHIDIPKTPFIVSSESGSTVEPNIFKQLRSDLRAGARNSAAAGRRLCNLLGIGCEAEMASRQPARCRRYGVILAPSTSLGAKQCNSEW